MSSQPNCSFATAVALGPTPVQEEKSAPEDVGPSRLLGWAVGFADLIQRLQA